MGFSSQPGTAPGGTDRDTNDWMRLRHSRDRHEGFQVGCYLQPPPMLFTRDGHNLFLGDMYRGQAAFLICSGPSLKQHDLSLLHSRGILTMAVNNAAVVHRPGLWCSVDDPGNFCDAIWRDPGITKFIPLCHMEKNFTVRSELGELVPSHERVGDMPAVVGFRRNEAFVARQWLYEDTFNWGNRSDLVDDQGNKGSRSVMYVALRLLFYLGIRRVYLLGCDFRMQHGKSNYAFEQDRSRGSVRGNNSSYRILNSRLKQLRPFFEREGFEVINCTPGSGLNVFPFFPFEQAVDQACSIIPSRMVTQGMYDRRQREQGAASNPQAEGAGLEGEYPRNVEDPEDILKDLTLLTAIDAEYAGKLKQTWPTWMKYRPELRNVPVVIIHDARFDPHTSGLADSLDHPQLRWVPWEMDSAESQRERMLTAFVQVAADHVQTKWYLKLDADVMAARSGPWIDAAWFAADQHGREPAFVASPWGYTKPADAISRLDEWGDSIPALQSQPRLNLAFNPVSSLVKHERIASWCFFGNTAWTREIAALAPDRLPVPSHDTYLFYCAARRGDHFVRVRMKRYGWETISRYRKLKQRCREVLAEKDPGDVTENCPVPADGPRADQGILYLLSGDAHAARLVVSVESLRRHYDGPVTVVSACSSAAAICRQLAEDTRLGIEHLCLEQVELQGRKSAYLFKPQLHRCTPYETTVYLDADTLVVGPLDELFDLPAPEHFIATQFTDWKTRGRQISRRIRSWHDTHPELVEPALQFGPAVNSGVFAFNRQSQLFTRWEEVSQAGRSHFIPDELALQLLLPQFPHVVLDGRFNWSARHGRENHPDTRVIHFHGNRHLSARADLWLTAFRKCFEQNLGNLQNWSPAGDRRLAACLAQDGLLNTHDNQPAAEAAIH